MICCTDIKQEDQESNLHIWDEWKFIITVITSEKQFLLYNQRKVSTRNTGNWTSFSFQVKAEVNKGLV